MSTSSFQTSDVSFAPFGAPWWAVPFRCTSEGSGARVPPGRYGDPVSPDEVLAARGQMLGGDDVSGGVESPGEAAGDKSRGESIEQPGKVMRIGSMVRQLLEEVRHAPLDEKGRERLREIYEESVRELASGLSPDLAAELDRMSAPFEDRTPSEAELRIAQAQLVGWLEGLFHGIQATLVAQQMAARAQLQEMRQPGLPPGAEQSSTATARPGTYL